MKRLSVLTAALCVLAIGVTVAVSAQKGANFAGTWALDKSKSELGQRMQNIDSLTWTITQDDQAIVRTQKVEGGGGQGGGGGRGMGGGPATYKLDGSESVAENPRGKTTSKIKWLEGGKILEIGSVSNVSMQGNEITINGTEHWELAEGGKVLKVHQIRETPQGKMESKMVFNKQ